MDKPTIHCFAAITTRTGEVWGAVHRVRLEMVPWLMDLGYSIVGPDPIELQDLAKWEREARADP